jgi:hypothetical protein
MAASGAMPLRALRALGAIPPPPFAPVLAPIDALRSRLLRALAPRARSLFVVREERVALVASLLFLSALVSASLLPIVIIALGPLVWGVPHVISDVRYLITRPGLHRRPAVLAAIACATVAAALGYGVRGALAGAAFAVLLSRAPWRRKALMVASLGALFAAAQWAGWFADLAFVHLHNLVGVILWWAWRSRKGRLHWLPLAIFAAGTALILSGAVEPAVARAGGLTAAWTGLSFSHAAWMMSPTTQGAIAVRLVVLYAFAQSAHYVVWLRLIPEDDRPSPTPRSFAQSLRALHADVGGAVLWTALLVALGLGCWAAVSVASARDGYIWAVSFHGYLEIVAAAVLWAEGWRPGSKLAAAA